MRWKEDVGARSTHPRTLKTDHCSQSYCKKKTECALNYETHFTTHPAAEKKQDAFVAQSKLAARQRQQAAFSSNPVAFEQAFESLALTRVGEVVDDGQLSIEVAGRPLLRRPLDELKEAWQQPLRW